MVDLPELPPTPKSTNVGQTRRFSLRAARCASPQSDAARAYRIREAGPRGDYAHPSGSCSNSRLVATVPERRQHPLWEPTGRLMRRALQRTRHGRCEAAPLAYRPPGHTWLGSDSTRQNSTECCPNLVDVRRCLREHGRIRPNLGNVGPTLGQTRPTSVDVGQTRAKFGRYMTKSDQTWNCIRPPPTSSCRPTSALRNLNAVINSVLVF